MKTYTRSLITFAVIVLLTACGGGSDGEATATTETPTPALAGTLAPEPTASPIPAPTPSPLTCVAPAIGSTGYSLVFKGCDAANVPQFYDKTECVRDNATGLIWEGKTTSGLRASTNTYTNYDDTSGLQKIVGVSGGRFIYTTPTFADLYASTNSLGYQDAVNATNLCGYGKWYRPSVDQLNTLVKPSEFPLIDNFWFPNMPPISISDDPHTRIYVYLTSTRYPTTSENVSWYISFDHIPSGGYFSRGAREYIRLVYKEFP